MSRETEKRALALKSLTVRPEPGLLASPLDYIAADHYRQRVLCGVLDAMAGSTDTDAEFAAHIKIFLSQDFSLHVLDEEEDLFPLLRRRALPEDDIRRTLGQLSGEHATDKVDARAILDCLDALAKGGDCLDREEPWPELFSRFAANERRHLVVENAIVLPLARARLTSGDLQNLGRRMAARRGISYPEMPNAH